MYQNWYSTETLTSKTAHLTASQNAVTLVGTIVLNWNRILSHFDRLDVVCRSIRSPNRLIGTLFWPQIIVLAWICSSELHIYDIIWRKKQQSFLPSSGYTAISILCVARWRSARSMIEWMCVTAACINPYYQIVVLSPYRNGTTNVTIYLYGFQWKFCIVFYWYNFWYDCWYDW